MNPSPAKRLKKTILLQKDQSSESDTEIMVVRDDFQTQLAKTRQEHADRCLAIKLQQQEEQSFHDQQLAEKLSLELAPSSLSLPTQPSPPTTFLPNLTSSQSTSSRSSPSTLSTSSALPPGPFGLSARPKIVLDGKVVPEEYVGRRKIREELEALYRKNDKSRLDVGRMKSLQDQMIEMVLSQVQDNEIDLHECHVKQATKAIDRYVEWMTKIDLDFHHITIVTGYGKSGKPPKIKKQIEQYLHIMDYQFTPDIHGRVKNIGALKVCLKHCPPESRCLELVGDNS